MEDLCPIMITAAHRVKPAFPYFLSYSEYGTKQVICPQCKSEKVQRRIGRIRVLRSDESRMAQFGDPDQLDGLEDDPKALGRMMRQMKGEVGEDMGPEFDEVVSRLEKGQSPDQIEQELPDLGEPNMGDGMGESSFGLD